MWTETNGTDMALSFQEAEGCAAIWSVPTILRARLLQCLRRLVDLWLIITLYRDFVSQVQQHLLAMGGPGTFIACVGYFQGNVLAGCLLRDLAEHVRNDADDALSDDAMDSFPNPVVLPPPELGTLGEIEQMMHVASASPAGRDSLSKFVISDNYIQKMLPLVSTAEDLEALPELHRLCRIMKMLILLNDTQIIEHVVSDSIVLGVVGALECRYLTCKSMEPS